MEKIIFNSLDWIDYHEGDYDDENDDQTYIIEMFGKTKDNKSVYVKVNNFTPFFYIELDEKWDNNKIKILMQTIQSKQIFYGITKTYFHSCDILEKHKLYGFTGNKHFKFIRLIFENHIAMRKASYLFKNGIKIYTISREKIKFRVYESNIDPILRCMHIRNILPCGWISIDKYHKIPNNKNVDISIETTWTNLKHVENNELAPIKIMSYDIECTSEDGSFPQPYRDNDKIIQIGNTFNILGSKDCYYKNIITLKSCDDIEDVDVEYYDTEEEVIIAWCKMLIKQDPDIITGWNIFGFDNTYIYERAVKLGIEDHVLKLGRVSNRKLPFIIKNLSSAALGDNKLKFFNMQGRVQIDLMKVVQRDYKLDSYKLDNVAEEFITGDIKSIKIKRRSKTSEIEITNISDIIIGNFVKLSIAISKFDTSYYKDGIKLKIIKIKENTITINHIIEDIETKWKWGLVKDDIKPADIFRLQKGSSSDRKMVAEYCVQDCVLCNKLMEKLCILFNNIAMANVCNVPLSYIFLRGQGIKVLSLVAKYCRTENFLIPILDIKKDKDDDEKIGYEGATVFKPKIGFYNRPVAVLDYASLYPSSMMHKNLSHEMYVDIGGQYDNLKGYKYRNIQFKNSDDTKTTCRYAQKEDNSLGIMPSILKDLLSQRKRVKKLIKEENNPFKKDILDGQQLAYKLTANSLYGQLGSSFSPIYKKEIAASTTATGRLMLELARDYTEKDFPIIIENIYNNLDNKEELDKIYKKELRKDLYENDECKNKISNIVNNIIGDNSITPNVVYGDTDSIFIDFEIKDKKTNEFLVKDDVLKYAIDLGLVCGMLIKSRLEYPHDLEYEKTFWPFCIFTKKRYIGNKYELDPKKFKQNYNGIVLKRRDNAPIVKEIVGGIADILLNERDLYKSIDFLNTSVDKLLKGEYPLKYFITSKTLKGKYAFRERNPHVCLSDRMYDRDPGSAPNINERVPFITVKINEEDIYIRKIKQNNINIKNSLHYCNKIEFNKIFELYEKIKNSKDKKDIKKLEALYITEFNPMQKRIHMIREYISTQCIDPLEKQKQETRIRKYEKIKLIQNNIYDKVRKDFIKYIEKYKDYKNELSEEDMYYKLKELIIKHGNARPNIIQGDRVEHPDFIKKNNLEIDFLFYLTNQIIKPVSQFYSFNIENIGKTTYGDIEFEERCSIAGELLFEKHLLSDKEVKGREKLVERRLKKENCSIDFIDDEIKLIDNKKKSVKDKIKKERDEIKRIEKEKKKKEKELNKKPKKPRKKKVILEVNDVPVKNIGEIPDP